jgi:hypothetical protein
VRTGHRWPRSIASVFVQARACRGGFHRAFAGCRGQPAASG